ncbi:TetR/AcrR family transcriptional regulator [Fundicoccus sp. Sow4_D5]|uniref:TetR/AcrR family transcriptional regulator n=1 Tax=unclassified Fundicoccus TaxID=2761543 RepID=UPI003F93DE17
MKEVTFIIDKLDLRVQKTYKSLIDSFEGLLREKEFEKISVKEICDAAVIRRPTFYKHFLDKYDFLSFFIKHKMGIIFDHAFHNLNDDGTNFFILVFEQLLDQFDNLSFLIFRLQMNSDINIELENIQEYGQNMLNKRVSGGENTSGIAMGSEYKGQIIMGITIQSVYWYKNNQDRMSRTEIIELYQQTLAKLW